MLHNLSTIIGLIVGSFMGWGDWAIVGISSIGSLISSKDGQYIEIVMVH